MKILYSLFFLLVATSSFATTFEGKFIQGSFVLGQTDPGTEVFIDNVDNANGETSLSREKAVKQKAWHDLQECFNNNSTVTGIPFN